MNAAQALADLTEISTQIQGAVLADVEGHVVGSTFPEKARGDGVARTALELLRAADEARGNGANAPSQVEAATQEGSVFLVRDERHVVAAITSPDPTVGLVFYDLKTCLRLVGQDEEKPKVKPARRAKKTATKDRGGDA